MVDAADHAVVGTQVGRVFFRRIPSPKIADAIHRILHELRVALKNIRVGQARRGDLDILVHAVNRLWPGEVPDARSLVSVLGMGGVETNRQTKRGIALLLVDKLDRPVASQLGLVAQRAIRLLFQVGVAADWLEGIKHRLAVYLRDFDTELADKSGAITGSAQHRRIARLTELADNCWRAKGELVRPLVEAGQESGPAGGADRRSNEHVAETHPLRGQTIHRRRLQKRMPSAAHAIPTMVVRQEKDDVRPIGSLGQSAYQGSG